MSISIHGKNYVTVAERIQMFHAKFPNGSIRCDVSYEGDLVRARAYVVPDEATPSRWFTGHSEEDRKDGMINKTSALENCETSAVGRALGFLGIGSEASVATAEEVSRAIAKQELFAQPAPSYVKKSYYNGNKTV